jgi:hypothetical protein
MHDDHVCNVYSSYDESTILAHPARACKGSSCHGRLTPKRRTRHTCMEPDLSRRFLHAEHH